MFHWAWENFILNSIGEKKNHHQFSLVHEGWGGHWLDGGKDFKTSIGQRKQAQGGGDGRLTKEDLMCFWEGEGGGRVCEEKISSYVWKNCCSWKKQNVCKQRAWEEVVCNK